MTTESSSLALASSIRSEALRIGFSACGFAPVQPVPDAVFNRWREWIARGDHDTMRYMENHASIRRNPQELLPQARTIISLAVNYFPRKEMPAENPRFAYYAYGKDYHEVVRGMLQELSQYIHTHIDSNAAMRTCCDTAPIFERYWAMRAGIGYIGRNSQLIIPGSGSYYFLGEIITTLDIAPSQPLDNSCKACRRCIDACPVGAIREDGSIDARKCISCQTIENRYDIPDHTVRHMGKRIYGCDTCQQVCPHNSHATATHISAFTPHEDMASLTYEKLRQLTRQEYNTIFRHSAVKRAKYEGLMRNLAALDNTLFTPEE